MSTLLKISMTLTAAILLLACGGADAPSLPINTIKNKPTKLTKINSGAELETNIKASLFSQYGQIAEAEFFLASAESNQTTTVNSVTNTQEADVDEADRLKTDGNYLYFSRVNSAGINIFKAGDNHASSVGSLDIKTLNNNSLSDLYLLSDKKQLIALAGDGKHKLSIWNNWFEPNFWQSRKTELFTVDISDPTAPKQTQKLSLDGQLISSRRIGDTLYLATRHTPHLPDLINYPANKAEANKNQQLINASSVAELLPQYQVGTQQAQPLFEAGECLVTTTRKDSSYKQNSIISLLAVNLNNPLTKPTGQCFAGDTETLYASSEAIYLASTQYSYTHGVDGLVYSGQPNTDIHKFSLDGSTPSYTSSGSIKGHLGWQQDLKPFRMSEHEGVLRVITYVGEEADNENSPARLFTLVENSTNKTLDTLAQLPNAARPEPLGKVGEQIYASRFMGKRGYLVTFRLTDPLYVLDLSDPSDPFIASALEIDGYSDYLHPVGENYLLGIGKDATADTTGGDGGRGAWYQGVKLSLIDISDPTAPFEKQTINIGKRGTESAVSQTHHALTSLLKGDTLHIALPISLHDTVNPQFEQYTNEPWYSYQWTHNELYRLNINTISGEINTLPAIVGSSSTDTEASYNISWPYDRSAMVGDSVYYLNEDQVVTQSPL